MIPKYTFEPEYIYRCERTGYDRWARPTEVFDNKEDALEELERMRRAKIHSLKEWIDRLEKMSFE